MQIFISHTYPDARLCFWNRAAFFVREKAENFLAILEKKVVIIFPPKKFLPPSPPKF